MGYIKAFDGSTNREFGIGGVDKNDKPNPTEIEGHYMGYITIEGKYGAKKKFVFRTAEGDVGVYERGNLGRLLADNKIGQMCKVAFLGMRPPKTRGQNPSYNYELLHDPENTISLALTSLASGPSPSAELVQEDDTDESLSDETSYAAPVSPPTPASAPSAERRARVQSMLNNGRARS